MADAARAVAHVEPHPTSTGTDNRKLLMWIFLGSECLLFGALIASYLIFRGEPSSYEAIVDGVRTFLPPHDQIIDGVEYEGILDLPITSQSTFVLLMSSLSMALAVYGARHNRPTMMKGWLLATVLLGLTFLGYQIFEFRSFGQEGLNLGANQFGASFFLLTGTHGTHVAVGVLYLLSLLASASFRRDGLGPEQGLLVETAGLYWHFVDAVWIVIFTVIYLIPVEVLSTP